MISICFNDLTQPRQSSKSGDYIPCKGTMSDTQPFILELRKPEVMDRDGLPTPRPKAC